MKIGLLNPWSNAAENQLIPAIERAALSLGHTTVQCKTTKDVLHHQPDFILSMSRTQPKLTDIPTYGLVFDPRNIVVEQPAYLDGLLSYDGVFTIFDTLKAFLSDLMFATQRDTEIGYFYPTATEIEWETPISFASAHLAYFGINWDRRRQGLFALLDQQPWMDIHGPEHGWTFLTGSSYKGMVPFDGISVLLRYRRAGAGLCLFSDSHFADNIITSRVFEICSAGAIVIASRMPWLEEHFGDTVLYIDQDRPDREIAQQIEAHMLWIRNNPGDAEQLAERAQRIFRERFSLDVLLPNVLELHERVVASRNQEQRETADISLSVVLLCDGTPPDALQRSLESIARQGHARTEIVVSIPQEAPPDQYETVAAAFRSRFERCEVVQASDEHRSSLLWSTLDRCSGELISIVTGGDEWMAGHVASLIRALDDDTSGGLACSGSVVQHERAFITRGGNQETRRINPFPFTAPREDVVQDALSTPLSSVMFRRSLLDRWILADPQMARRYEAYFVLALLQKAAPAFTYRATTLHYEADAPQRPQDDPAHLEDLTRLRLRFVGRTFPTAPRLIDLEALQGAVERGETRRQRDVGVVQRHDGVCAYRVPVSFTQLVGPEEHWEPVAISISADDVELAGQPEPTPSEALFPLVVEPPREPWAHGLHWRIPFPEERPYVVRLDCRVEGGTAGFGVLAGAWQHFNYRVFVPSQDDRVVVDLPIARPSDVEGIVVQSTLGSEAIQVAINGVQLFAATARLPLAAINTLVEENGRLRMTQAVVEQQLQDASERLDATLTAQQRLQGERDDLYAAHATVEQQLQDASERLQAATATQQRLQSDRDDLHVALAEARRDRDAVTKALRASEKRIQEMRSSKIWRLGTLYWRLFSRST